MAGGIAVRRVEFNRDLIAFVITPLIVLGILLLDGGHTLPLWSSVPLTITAIYFVWSLRGRQENDGAVSENEVRTDDADKFNSAARGFIYFGIGTFALYLGGRFTVIAAENIAEGWGISRNIIGLTVVALLTSAPDIAATWAAARRGENGMAVGSILGSNISNIVIVLNATVLTAGIFAAADESNPALAATAVGDHHELAMMMRVDYFLVALLSLMAWCVACYRQRLDRITGVIMLLSYVAYLVFRVGTAIF